MSRGQKRISLVQQGAITEREYAKFAMMGSGGLVELYRPLTDEERRDYFLHIRNNPGVGLAMQIKSAMQLTRLSKNSLYLRIPFTVRKSHMAVDPLYWFFLAYLSPEIMGLADPAFLVPWDVLRKIADPEEKGDFWQFNFEASMEPGSQDKYAPYRVNTLDLGKKLLSILNDIRNSKISLPLVRQASTSLPLVGRVGEGVINIPDLVFTRRI